MTGGSLPADIKRTSALRRVPWPETVRFRSQCGSEGDVSAFELPRNAVPITVEAIGGRAMTIAPGDIFLATPGYRESTRWVSGGIPAGGLVPGDRYWVLADCGVVGELIADSPAENGHLGCVRYLGAVYGDHGETLNLSQFAEIGSREADRGAPVYLLVGTSGNVGKTTAGVAILRALRMKGHTTVAALKATGTSAVGEMAIYKDFGAAQVFDCVDFGLPTTYPSGRGGIRDIFVSALDFCLSLSADALLVECGGDVLGANVPEFLTCLTARRNDLKVIVAAADALGAMGAKQMLAQIGLTISLITGPCADTPTLRKRTQALCGTPAINLASSDQGTQSFLSGTASK